MSEETEIKETEIKETEIKETEIKETKSGDAKKASLLGKIVGGSEIFIGSVTLVVLVCFKQLTASEAKELFSIVLSCGLGIMACFGTVDINLMLEKFARR